MAYPPLLLIHGAANGAWIWERWRAQFKALEWQANVLDLRGHGRSLPTDLSETTMEDYLADVESVARQIEASAREHPVIGGWSMGGLIAMMYAAAHPETPALLLFAPSPPLQVQGRGSAAEVRATPSAPFGPELYGVFPDDQERSSEALFDLTPEEQAAVLRNSRGALESGFARRQRKRGISISHGAIRCPTLVVYGERDPHFPPDLNRRLALFLAADTLPAPGAGHWGVVYSETTVPALAPKVDAWLRDVLA
jgi:pimeloyl-ACP methyl ester carboxylesterase